MPPGRYDLSRIRTKSKRRDQAEALRGKSMTGLERQSEENISQVTDYRIVLRHWHSLFLRRVLMLII